MSDSGRQEGTEPKLVINSKNEKPVFRLIPQPEQKPNYKAPTPQMDLRRSGMSPNTAEGKERLGLKDLARLAAEHKDSKVEFKKTPSEPTKKTEIAKLGKGVLKKKGKKGRKKKAEKTTASTPVTPPATPVSSPVDSPKLEQQKQSFPTPVTPEVEYQEKSTVTIQPSHNSLPLTTPVKRTDGFANKDNSVDGFLSIKH